MNWQQSQHFRKSLIILPHLTRAKRRQITPLNSRFLLIRDWSKSIGVVGRSRERVGHEVLSLVQGVGRAIFSYPLGVGQPTLLHR